MPQHHVYLVGNSSILYLEFKLRPEAALPFKVGNCYYFLVQVNGITGGKDKDNDAYEENTATFNSATDHKNNNGF
jgi:hypothetical protein